MQVLRTVSAIGSIRNSPRAFLADVLSLCLEHENKNRDDIVVHHHLYLLLAANSRELQVLKYLRLDILVPKVIL
jgi:hypothetical protein